MATLGGSRRQLASLLWKATVSDEVNAELDFHVEMRTREYMARGMDPTAARVKAIARFGNIDAVNAECRTIGTQRERDMKRTEYLSELAHDIRFSLRQLAKSPGFALVAILTLALGVGATTAIFSAVEAVVLRPFPFTDPSRLVFAFTHWKFGDGGVSVGDYADWKRRSTAFTHLGAFRFLGVTISNGESPARIAAAYSTANVFPMYGVKPQLGRVFTADEDQPGQADVVVLSDAFWKETFGGAMDVTRKTLVVNGRPHAIIGVMPPGFDPTDSHEALWMPIRFTPEQIAEHDNHSMTIVGRLKPGITIMAAQREMDAIAKQMSFEFPKTNSESGVSIKDFAETIVGSYHTRLLVLLGAVWCVLLIACGNVANLLLARGAARAKELAIRTAIGAGRGRIIRQLLTESLVLAMMATAIGLGLAWVGVHIIIGAAPATIPRLSETRIDGGVLLFALGVAVISSVIFGLVPALRAAGGNLQSSLRDGGRAAIASVRDRVRGVLVATEVAVALTLLIGAGLLIRSAFYLSRVDPGFDPRGMLVARVALKPTNDLAADAANAEATFLRLVAELRARPGVAAAAVTSVAPLGGGGGSNGLVPFGKEPIQANIVDARRRMVTPGYLAAMRIPLIAGRDINEQDVRGGLRVMVLSATAAKRLFPNENAIGKRVHCCEGTETDPRLKTIVGVAADVHTGGPTQELYPEFYIPVAQVPAEAWQWSNRTMSIVVRARSGNPASLTPAIREVMKSLDPAAPVYNVATMNELLQRSMAEARFHLMLLASLAAVGLLLAAAGIYSVIAYFVTLRTHEIGVRMALGATRRDVMRLLTWGGLRPVLAGAVLGGVFAAWASRLLQGSLYGVESRDPTTFVLVTAVLLAVAIVAILVPARRATLVDPTRALTGA